MTAAWSQAGQPSWTPVARVAEIERAWARLRHAAAATGEPGEVAPARALALNLIVRAENPADTQQMAELLWPLGLRHPARVLLIVTGGQDTPRLRVAAAARGSELVEIEVRPERAASVAAALLDSELETVLVWRGGHPERGAEFEALAALAQRVLVDGERLGLGPASLAAWARALPAPVQLSDLTWSRLTPWRQLLCQVLECEPNAADRIAQITIVAGERGGDHLASVLLAGWLARQLRWQPRERVAAHTLDMQRESGAAVRLRLESGAGPRERLERVLVEGEGFSAEIAHHGHHLDFTHHGAGGLIGHWAGATLAEARGEASCWNEEFELHGGDPAYRHALERGCEIVARLERTAA